MSDDESIEDDGEILTGIDTEISDTCIMSDTAAYGACDADIDDIVEMEETMKTIDLATEVPQPREDDDLDLDALFSGNIHLAEHYREQLKSTNADDFRRRDYAKGTEKTIVNSENQWRR